MSPACRYGSRVGLLAAGVLLAAGLVGCEYADDGGSATARGPAVAPTPTMVSGPAKDPEMVALEARNFAKVEALLGSSTEGFLFGGMGGIGSDDSDGLTTTGLLTESGSYTVSAVCVGAHNARVAVGQFGSESLLELEFECGTTVGRQVQLTAGAVILSVFGAKLAGAELGRAAPVAAIRVRLGARAAAAPNP